MGNGSGGNVNLNPFDSPLWKPQGTRALESTFGALEQSGGPSFRAPGMGEPAGIDLAQNSANLKGWNERQLAQSVVDQAMPEEMARRKAEENRMASEKKNQDYLANAAKMSQLSADTEAMVAARNAARKARGNELFGAWG